MGTKPWYIVPHNPPKHINCVSFQYPIMSVENAMKVLFSTNSEVLREQHKVRDYTSEYWRVISHHRSLTLPASPRLRHDHEITYNGALIQYVFEDPIEEPIVEKRRPTTVEEFKGPASDAKWVANLFMYKHYLAAEKANNQKTQSHGRQFLKSIKKKFNSLLRRSTPQLSGY